MNSAKIKKKIVNFKKIKDIIEISKLDTINKLHSAEKVARTHFEMSMVAKQALDFAYDNYWIKKLLFKNKKGKGTTWVFATLTTTLLSTPYTEQEKMIKDNFDYEKDSIIAIGKFAIKFANKNKMKIIYQEKDLDKAISQAPSIIASLYIGGHSNKINFVSNSQYINEKPLTILPIEELDIKFKHNHNFNNNFSFFPSIDKVLENIFKTYTQRMIEALIRETKYFYLKQKLIRHEESIKTVDKRILETKSELTKVNRKIETEEIILVTQIANKGGNNE